MKSRRPKAVSSLLLALILAVGGCSSEDSSPHMDHLDENYRMSVSPPSLPYPASLDVRENDPESVALAAVRTIYGWDFQRDASGMDAVERAVPLMSAALANRLQALPPEPFIPPTTWASWETEETQTSVSARIAVDEHPADTPDQWQRRITVTIGVDAANGRELYQRTFAVAATAQRQAGQWVLAQFQPLGI